MSEPIDLSFHYTQQDYVRGYRAHAFARTPFFVDVLFAIGVAALGAWCWTLPDFHLWGAGAMLAGAIFLALVVAAYWIIPVTVFRREPKFRDDYRMVFSAEGIHFKTVNIDSQLQWTLYTHALAANYCYLLYYGKRHLTIIPLRVFQSSKEQERFDAMIRQHIPRIETKNR